MKSTLLKPLYSKAVGGLPFLGSPAEAARRAETTSPDALVTLYVSLSGATGFVCGLPGFLLLPVTLPANVAGVALLQLHLCASFATLGGHDLEAAETRDRSIACLLEKIDASGQNTEDEEVATRTGIKLAERGVRFVAEQSTRLVKKAAKGYALRKVGARRLPLLGGVIGAGSDAYTTWHVGRCARATFLTPDASRLADAAQA